MSGPAQRPIRSYRDLIVWQKAMDVVDECYILARKMPKEEVYGLTRQFLRAAVSVPSNIGEGHGRRYTGHFLHHLSIANGSLKELETQLYVAVRQRFITKEDVRPAFSLADEVGRMLTVLIVKLSKKRRSTTETAIPTKKEP